jgi:uncharacterized protein (DUF2062 family)
MTMRNWLHRKLVEPLIALLVQGLSPSRLALCVAIGVMVGNIPILGISTILCSLIAIVFRLNLPAMQLVQAAMAPTQLLLIIPFVRLGEWLTHAPSQALSIRAGIALIAQGVWHAVVLLKDAIFHAGLAWLLLAPGCIYLLHRLFTPWFERMAAQLDLQSQRRPYQ